MVIVHGLFKGKILMNNYIASAQEKKKNLLFLCGFVVVIPVPAYCLSLWYRVKEMGRKMKEFERDEEGT